LAVPEAAPELDFEPGRGIEPELLDAEPEPALEPGHVASSFDSSFRQAAQAAEPEPAVGPEPVAAAPTSLFAVKGLGTPALVDSHTLAVPLRLRDATGRVRQLTLRLRFEAIEDERA
jgi:hypothetical protein